VCAALQVDAASPEALVALLAAREERLLRELAAAMAGAGADVFDTWMKRRSDLVQSTAEAYVSLVVAQAAQRSLASASAHLCGVLSTLLRLDLLQRVRKHLDWYLLEGLLASAEARQVRRSSCERAACLVCSVGITCLSAPSALCAAPHGASAACNVRPLPPWQRLCAALGAGGGLHRSHIAAETGCSCG
jgi:Acyl-CoA oxidase